MGDRKSGMGNAELSGYLGCPTVKLQAGAAAGFPHYLDFKPVHAATDARAQRFSTCFLGRKARSQALGSVAFAHAVGLLCCGEDAIEEALSEALERLLDARNFNKINAAAYDHPVYQANIPQQVF